MTNAELGKLYNLLNERFFGDKLPKDQRVSYSLLSDNDDGEFDGDIAIHKDLKRSDSFTTIVLLHEMVHLELTMDGYAGYERDGQHGLRFQARIWELVKAGAYDGLL